LVIGLDPSPVNVEAMNHFGREAYLGTIDEFMKRPVDLGGMATAMARLEKYDVVSLNWTLENTGDCIAVLKQAHSLLRPGGRVVVATGSRILVPYKKPLRAYLRGALPSDLHCFRFSAKSLDRALAKAGFGKPTFNDYRMRDEMVVAAPVARGERFTENDDPDEVIDFFASWEKAFP
jgi:SAM-dependent methyltransferase